MESIPSNKNTKRRSSIFKPKDTASVLSELCYPQDYKEKLIIEIQEWPQITKDCEEELNKFKQDLDSKTIEKVDRSKLSKAQQNLLDGAINYEDYILRTQNVCTKAKFLITKHNHAREAYRMKVKFSENKIEKAEEMIVKEIKKHI